MAWLNLHGCRANGIVNMSVELFARDDGSEEYVSIWRSAGLIFVIDGDVLVRHAVFIAGAGHLVYGFDEIDY